MFRFKCVYTASEQNYSLDRRNEVLQISKNGVSERPIYYSSVKDLNLYLHGVGVQKLAFAKSKHLKIPNSNQSCTELRNNR